MLPVRAANALGPLMRRVQGCTFRRPITLPLRPPPPIARTRGRASSRGHSSFWLSTNRNPRSQIRELAINAPSTDALHVVRRFHLSTDSRSSHCPVVLTLHRREGRNREAEADRRREHPPDVAEADKHVAGRGLQRSAALQRQRRERRLVKATPDSSGGGRPRQEETGV